MGVRDGLQLLRVLRDSSGSALGLQLRKRSAQRVFVIRRCIAKCRSSAQHRQRLQCVSQRRFTRGKFSRGKRANLRGSAMFVQGGSKAFDHFSHAEFVQRNCAQTGKRGGAWLWLRPNGVEDGRRGGWRGDGGSGNRFRRFFNPYGVATRKLGEFGQVKLNRRSSRLRRFFRCRCRCSLAGWDGQIRVTPGRRGKWHRAQRIIKAFRAQIARWVNRTHAAPSGLDQRNALRLAACAAVAIGGEGKQAAAQQSCGKSGKDRLRINVPGANDRAAQGHPDQGRWQHEHGKSAQQCAPDTKQRRERPMGCQWGPIALL